jgi:hypothetical protein
LYRRIPLEFYVIEDLLVAHGISLYHPGARKEEQTGASYYWNSNE